MTETITQIEDLYPTRSVDHPNRIERPDPVVWGNGQGGPLDAATVQHYEDTGYLTVDQLVSADELADMQDELTRLSEDPVVRADERTIVEPRSQGVRSVFEIHNSSEVFKKIANDPRIVDRARQLLGSDVYIHQSRVNFKPGFEGKEFSWHSDFETWHAEDGMAHTRAVSISISLTRNYSFNGPLMIMPGTHKHFVQCVGKTPEDNYRASLQMQGAGTPDKKTLEEFADTYGIDVLEGDAGGAIMFDSNCMHASNSNITPFARSNVFIVYNSVENACGEPFAAPKRRPEFAGSRDFTPAGR